MVKYSIERVLEPVQRPDPIPNISQIGGFFMSNLRSDRARRRATRQRNQRILLIFIFLVIIAGGAYIALSGRSSKQASVTDLKIEDLVQGSGPAAKAGDSVTVNYTGWLTDVTKFDSSLDSGQPFTFTLGTGSVITGWDQGLAGMQVGGKRKLTIPPNLGYGAQANGPIPANSTLIFEVELLSIN
jgi:FKBP-type peptidyl-prolyl cis-trans isomerase FkpA